MNMMKKTLICTGVALALGSQGANAALVENIFGANTFSTDSANFTMLLASGASQGGGTNDVQMDWDGNAYNASSDYIGAGSAANITASSTTTFNGFIWTAHDIQVFTPGSYSFDTNLSGGVVEDSPLEVTVGATQIGMHMLFDWNGNLNIDVFVVAESNSVYGSGERRFDHNTTFGNSCDDGTFKNCLFDGLGFGTDGRPDKDQVWMLATVDGDGDGVMGIPMKEGGPFQFFNAGFNATMEATAKPPAVVPVPAAVWLFGSGLLGLVGIGRRKKRS